MGLKISELIPKRDIKIEDLAKKKIAVDASQMLYQFLSSIRQPDGTPLMDSQGRVTSHLVGIFSRVSNLITKDLKLCFVFDGKPPSLKLEEQESRSLRKKVAEEKRQLALEEGDIDSALKYSKQSSRLDWEMVGEAKELISAMGLPVVQAPSEAEAQASFMCKKGDVWAVASSDHDCLVYGAPRLIMNLTLSSKRKLASGSYVWIVPTIIELDEVLESLDINKEQLLALAILSGTDFNVGGVKGIGPKKALELVKEYKTAEKVFAHVKPEFDWKRVYNIFKKMPTTDDYSLKWGRVDEDRIRKLLVDEHDFSEERVNKTLEKLGNVGKGQKGLGDFL
ncbi:MAG: flap endonuclease-1 [Candidatus Nanoarchaeia archaeon]